MKTSGKWYNEGRGRIRTEYGMKKKHETIKQRNCLKNIRKNNLDLIVAEIDKMKEIEHAE